MLFRASGTRNSGTAFNFNQAVAAIKSNYPDETRAVAFIDTSSWLARMRLHYELFMTSPEYKAALMRGTDTKSQSEIITKLLKYGFSSTRDVMTGRSLATINSAKSKFLPINNLHFALDHEFGHLGVPNAVKEDLHIKRHLSGDVEAYSEITSDNNERETKADIFATLWGLKRGTLQRDEVKKLSVNRALHAYFSNDVDHATTAGLDNILLTMSDTKIHSLSPQEITAIADKHGREFALSESEISELLCHLHLQPRLNKEAPVEECLNALLAAAKNETHAPVAARFSAHILSHILDNGSIDFPYKLEFDVKGPAFDKMREELADVLEKSHIGKSVSVLRYPPQIGTA